MKPHPCIKNYAWRRIESPPNDPVPYYHVAVELHDGRRFWRLWILADKEPGDWMFPEFLVPEQFFGGGPGCWHQLPN